MQRLVGMWHTVYVHCNGLSVKSGSLNLFDEQVRLYFVIINQNQFNYPSNYWNVQHISLPLTILSTYDAWFCTTYKFIHFCVYMIWFIWCVCLFVCWLFFSSVFWRAISIFQYSNQTMKRKKNRRRSIFVYATCNELVFSTSFFSPSHTLTFLHFLSLFFVGILSIMCCVYLSCAVTSFYYTSKQIYHFYL